MSVMKRHTALAALVAGLTASAPALAEYGLNLPRGVTPISQEAYDLHMMILWICVAIGITVFGAMFISMLLHRKSRGAVAAQFHESTTIEIVWTVIPFIILAGMAIPATQALVKMEDTSNADITIKVTGFQWKWKYDYVDDGIGFMSVLSTPRDQIENQATKDESYLLDVDKPMVIPVGKKVRLLVTANDVIHAWWVPEFGMKKDAIPGFVNEMWVKADQPGTYRGQCAELCGKDHGFMPIVVIAKAEDEYLAWMAEQKAAAAASADDPNKVWTKEELVAKGEQVYNASCAACHQANGEGLPGTFPALKGSAIATGPVDGHIEIVFNGKPGTAMSAFSGQLSDSEIAAVVSYERNAWGNSGDIVQPSQIKAKR